MLSPLLASASHRADSRSSISYVKRHLWCPYGATSRWLNNGRATSTACGSYDTVRFLQVSLRHLTP